MRAVDQVGVLLAQETFATKITEEDAFIAFLEKPFNDIAEVLSPCFIPVDSRELAFDAHDAEELEVVDDERDFNAPQIVDISHKQPPCLLKKKPPPDLNLHILVPEQEEQEFKIKMTHETQEVATEKEFDPLLSSIPQELKIVEPQKNISIKPQETPPTHLTAAFQTLHTMMQSRSDFYVRFPIQHPLGLLDVRMKFKDDDIEATFLSDSEELTSLLSKNRHEVEKLLKNFSSLSIRFHYTGAL